MSEVIDSNSRHILKQNILKEDFNWEIPVESVPLPSKGMLYSPDTTLYNRETIPIKAMTAHEEDILSSQALIKEGIVIKSLINSCVTDRTFNVDELILGDRNALMIAIRVTGYGPDYKLVSSCLQCEHRNNININFGEIPINRLKINPVEDGKNEFEYTLPVTKKKVTFKFMTIKDERDKTLANKNVKNVLNTKIERNVTSFLNYSILSIDGIRDKNKIHHFIKYMPALDSKKLREFIKKNEPGMDMNHNYICQNCNYSNDLIIPLTSEFFWPST